LVATGAITAASLRKMQQTAIIIAVSTAASPKAKIQSNKEYSSYSPNKLQLLWQCQPAPTPQKAKNPVATMTNPEATAKATWPTKSTITCQQKKREHQEPKQ